MDGYFFDILCLLKKRTKSDSCAAHFEQHFNATMTNTDIHEYMTFKVLRQLNSIGEMKTFMKRNCNLCM